MFVAGLRNESACWASRWWKHHTTKRTHLAHRARWDSDRDDADRLVVGVKSCTSDIAISRLGNGYQSVRVVKFFVVLEVRAQFIECHRLHDESKAKVVWATTMPFDPARTEKEQVEGVRI